MNSSSTFGMRLRCVRDDHRLSLKKMGESAGVSASTWRSYENDITFPAESTLWNFCGIYHVNWEWLYENHGEMYLDSYKPGDPLGEPVSYSEKLKKDMQDILGRYYGHNTDETNHLLKRILGEIDKEKRS